MVFVSGGGKQRGEEKGDGDINEPNGRPDEEKRGRRPGKVKFEEPGLTIDATA
jgi:hypothetical protein